jgi:hypothetical protein
LQAVSTTAWGQLCAEASHKYLIFFKVSPKLLTLSFTVPVPADRLYFKRPILCLASSKILNPSPTLTARRVCTPRLCCGGRTHSLGGEGGGGSVLYIFYVLVLYSTLIHMPSPQFSLCHRMLGSNSGLLRLWHWQSYALTPRFKVTCL